MAREGKRVHFEKMVRWIKFKEQINEGWLGRRMDAQIYMQVIMVRHSSLTNLNHTLHGFVWIQSILHLLFNVSNWLFLFCVSLGSRLDCLFLFLGSLLRQSKNVFFLLHVSFLVLLALFSSLSQTDPFPSLRRVSKHDATLTSVSKR